jgi:hypothetical protein
MSRHPEIGGGGGAETEAEAEEGARTEHATRVEPLKLTINEVSFQT